jgi:hypothetical protein
MRNVARSRAFAPGLQSFEQWLAEKGSTIQLD